MMPTRIHGMPVNFSITTENIKHEKGHNKKKHHTPDLKEVKVQVALSHAAHGYEGAAITVTCRREKHAQKFELRNCEDSRNANMQKMLDDGAIRLADVNAMVARAKEVLRGKIPAKNLKANG